VRDDLFAAALRAARLAAQEGRDLAGAAVGVGVIVGVGVGVGVLVVAVIEGGAVEGGRVVIAILVAIVVCVVAIVVLVVVEIIVLVAAGSDRGVGAALIAEAGAARSGAIA
jgi:hypothetical protein